MDEAPNIYPNLSNQAQFGLNKINKIYFIAQICRKQAMSKGLSKYIVACDDFDKALIILSATTKNEYLSILLPKLLVRL